MTELPPGWVSVPLGDIRIDRSKSVDPRRTPTTEFDLYSVPSLATGRPETVQGAAVGSTKKRLSPGTVVISKINPRLNRVWVIPEAWGREQIGSSEWIVFSPTGSFVPKFLGYFLGSAPVRDHLAANVSGVGGSLMRVRPAALDRLEVRLPPLAEQHRIVEAIEEQLSRLDAGVASLQRAKRNLGRMRAAVATTLLGDASWPTRPLGDIADVVGGVTVNRQRDFADGLVELPYLRVANVQRGYLDLTEIKTIRVEPERAQALELLPGDVLLNEGGDRDKLGRGWVWEGQIEKCIHQNHVFRARLHANVNPKFVSMYANVLGREWFERMGSQTTNLASISRTALRQFPVPVPPSEEQERIMADIDRQFSILDAMEAAVEVGLTRAGRLRQSILADAFAGRLVPQDPADEPASTLLEQMHQERGTS